MQCTEILVLLLGTGIIIVAREEGVDSVDMWMEGTDLCKSLSIQDPNGTCQCATRYYLVRWPPSSTKAVPHAIVAWYTASLTVIKAVEFFGVWPVPTHN